MESVPKMDKELKYGNRTQEGLADCVENVPKED